MIHLYTQDARVQCGRSCDLHVSTDCCQSVCSNGYGTEAKFETGHKSTKRAFRRINKAADTPRDMAVHTCIARCDTIELLMTFLQRQRRDEAAAGWLGAQWDVLVEDEEGEETRVEGMSRLMAVGLGWTGPRRVSNVDELAARIPELAQLPFAVSVWLLRFSSPVTMDVAYSIGMPHLEGFADWCWEWGMSYRVYDTCMEEGVIKY